MKFDWTTILSTASAVMGVMLIILTIIIAKSKNKTTRETAQKVYDVISFIQGAIVKAETHSNYTGEDKFTIVATDLKQYLLDHKMNLTEETQKNLIENEITLSNAVNVDKKNKSDIISNEEV